MQPAPPCPAPASLWQMWASALLLPWDLPLGRWSVGFDYLFSLLVMLPSEVPRLATDSPVRVFPGVWKLLSFLRLPFQDRSLALPLFSLFFSFLFFPTSFQRQWAAFLGAWCPLPAFRSCFVEFAQRSNVLLMNLWGRKWSPHPIPLPSKDHPLGIYYFKMYAYKRMLFVSGIAYFMLYFSLVPLDLPKVEL